ncbi:MAG: hypothetical protein GQ570_04935 [Helicobacteraceae bacterium]|nr:hypothetical protein [Helicobacteraceae bacterium]
MKLLQKWLIPAITAGFAIFIGMFLFNINENVRISVDNISLEENKKSEVNAQVEQSAWLERFAQSERDGFFYPVNEIYIKLDLSKEIEKKQIFRLSAILRDPYQLFCLEQELKRHKLLYYLNKEQKGAELLIFSKDKTKLNSLVASLKNYHITAKVVLYKEDKKWKNKKS